MKCLDYTPWDMMAHNSAEHATGCGEILGTNRPTYISRRVIADRRLFFSPAYTSRFCSPEIQCFLYCCLHLGFVIQAFVPTVPYSYAHSTAHYGETEP